MSGGIPNNSNFRNLSCQLGGLSLNGNVAQQTASSYTVVTINDPAVVRHPTLNNSTTPVGYLQLAIGNTGSGPNYFYVPLFQ